jgi:Zn finger protein HypA/HybF involved in hydrogenase expression
MFTLIDTTMKNLEKECSCCGAVYKIAVIQPEIDDSGWDVQDETFDETEELYPEFCPFCGSHEDEEPVEDDE